MAYVPTDSQCLLYATLAQLARAIINIQIMNPTDITEEEEKLFEQLKKISKYNPREIHS